MKTNKMKIGMLALFGAMSINGAFAQEHAGNGGGVHVCYTDSTKTQIKSVETYDLWEGPVLNKQLSIAAWNGVETKEQIIQRILDKIALSQRGLAREMRKNIEFLNDPQVIINANQVSLELIKDARILLVGENCIYKQMVNWLDPNQFGPGSKDKILRDEDYYLYKLNPLSQAALDLHEAAYKAYRKFMGKEFKMYGSDMVRRFIAEAFSDSPISIALIAHQNDDGFSMDEFRNVKVIFNSKECNKNDLKIDITYLSGGCRRIMVKNSVILKVGQSYSDVMYKNHYNIDIKSGLLGVFGDANVEIKINGCGFKELKRQIYLTEESPSETILVNLESYLTI